MEVQQSGWPCTKLAVPSIGLYNQLQCLKASTQSVHLLDCTLLVCIATMFEAYAHDLLIHVGASVRGSPSYVSSPILVVNLGQEIEPWSDTTR